MAGSAIRLGTAMPPETKYARSGTVNIAYQVHGDGPIDLVMAPGWIFHLELAVSTPSAIASSRNDLASLMIAASCGVPSTSKPFGVRHGETRSSPPASPDV
jgi:hypothetical protein